MFRIFIILFIGLSLAALSFEPFWLGAWAIGFAVLLGVAFHSLWKLL